jgi:hypothetical protein
MGGLTLFPIRIAQGILAFAILILLAYGKLLFPDLKILADFGRQLFLTGQVRLRQMSTSYYSSRPGLS